MDVKNFDAFLKQNVKEILEVEYVASDRFIDGNNEPVKWKLRVLSNDELDKMRLIHTHRVSIKGTRQVEEKFNVAEFNDALLEASVIYPDLNSMVIQDSWGTSDAVATAKAMLTPGEYQDLQLAVLEAQGFESGMNEKVKTVKNS